MTLRNRRFLKKILPVSRNVVDLIPDLTPAQPEVPSNEPLPATSPSETSDPSEVTAPEQLTQPTIEEEGIRHLDEGAYHSDAPTVPPTHPLRRGTRERVQHVPFSARLKGKSHE